MPLSRDNLKNWVHQLQAAADVVRGCFVRILVDGNANCCKYHMACIDDISAIPSAHSFGRVTTNNQLSSLDFRHFSASTHMNTISKFLIFRTELDEWLHGRKLSLEDFEESRDRTQARRAKWRTNNAAQRSDRTMVDGIASDGSRCESVSCLATEMHQDTIKPLRDEQLCHSYEKQNSSQVDMDTRLQNLQKPEGGPAVSRGKGADATHKIL